MYRTGSMVMAKGCERWDLNRRVARQGKRYGTDTRTSPQSHRDGAEALHTGIAPARA